MSTIKLKLDGMTAEGHISMNATICVCGFCNNHDRENATIEFNFREQKIFYLCSECKKMNEISLTPPPHKPPPRVRMG